MALDMIHALGRNQLRQPALGTDTVVLVGIVVHDIEAKARAWSTLLAVPVPEILTTAAAEEARTEVLGEPSTAQAKLACFHVDNLQIELIEPIGGPSTWWEHLDRHGDGLHHVAFRVRGMVNTLAALDVAGVPLVQRGEFTGGRDAYVDGISRLGTILELLEHT